jgi:peptidoglycan hydrolase CwlO-like protein
MKTLDIKSFIIGILSTICIMLFMGFSSDDSHTHDATDIDYKSYKYGGYGSLQAAIKDLEDDLEDLKDNLEDLEDDLDDKADEYHYHY